MRVVIQRVTSAKVVIDGSEERSIGNGFLVLLGIKKGDDRAMADALASKVAELRIFCDENDKMNISLLSMGYEVMVISNFTLYADCSHGRRPSFINAARPEESEPLYEYFVDRLKSLGVSNVQTGKFGADMQVTLINDGPITIVIDSDELSIKK